MKYFRFSNYAAYGKEILVNFLIVLMVVIIGAIVGWVASFLMRTSNWEEGVVWDVAAGIMGAVIGAWLISPLFGIPGMNSSFSSGSLGVSLISALMLIVFVNLFRRGRVR